MLGLFTQTPSHIAITRPRAQKSGAIALTAPQYARH
jgi:hypothetical protein